MIFSKKKLILFIETTLKTLPFTKVSLSSSGSSISEKDPIALLSIKRQFEDMKIKVFIQVFGAFKYFKFHLKSGEDVYFV